MTDIVGVRFKPCGKVYDFEVNGSSVKPGMWIVVDSEMGLNLGLVVIAKHKAKNADNKFKKVIRIATVKDLEADRNNRSLEDDAMSYCVKSAKKHNLFMKIIRTEATLDRKRLIFYFTADGRIDFRELVRDLASKFKTRIEMRQIGVRDEVKHVGGIGCCGREVCCKSFLTSFEPISIRMAKKQELTLNPGKLSGICGRLMCCLGYEIELQGQKATNKKTVKDEDAPLPEKTSEETVKPEQAPQPHTDKTYTNKEKLTKQPSQHVSEKAQQQGKKEEITVQKRKDKGKPFSKRKRFRKKRKR